MKKAVKFIMVWAMALTMVISCQSLALASTNHTTGTLADGVYAASQPTATSSDQNPTEYRLSVIVDSGAVSVVQFGQYASGARFSVTFAAYITDEDQKAALLAACDEQEYYQTQANDLLDGAKVDMYTEAASDEMYNAFQTLWKEAIEQAGGKVEADAVEADETAADTTAVDTTEADTTEADTTEEDTTAADTSTDVPKTGVVGLGVVYGLATLATGALVLKKKK